MTFKEFITKNRDKWLHAAVCFILTTLGTAIFHAQPTRLLWGVGFAVLFAIGKEIYDAAKRAPLADQVFDLGFDIVGIVIACFCLTAIGA